jgi:hypothetical protein
LAAAERFCGTTTWALSMISTTWKATATVTQFKHEA